MILTRSRRFKKKVKKLPQPVKRALAMRLLVFIENPYDVRLNNHSLSGALRQYRSINITGDYRLIYENYERNAVRLIDIDTHSNLYGK